MSSWLNTSSAVVDNTRTGLSVARSPFFNIVWIFVTSLHHPAELGRGQKKMGRNKRERKKRERMKKLVCSAMLVANICRFPLHHHHHFYIHTQHTYVAKLFVDLIVLSNPYVLLILVLYSLTPPPLSIKVSGSTPDIIKFSTTIPSYHFKFQLQNGLLNI